MDSVSPSEGEGCGFESRRDVQTRMLNRPGGRRGFENRWCRKSWCHKNWCHKNWCHKAGASSAPAIRQPEGQPAGRSASVGSGLDAQALWIKTTAFRHGESIRAAPDPRSKRVSGVKPWRSTRRLSANSLPTAAVPAARERDEKPRNFPAGRSGTQAVS